MNNIISQPISFYNSDIRRTIKDGVTYYSVVDVIGAIRKKGCPSTYWSKLKNNQLSDAFPIWESMMLMKSNGQFQLADCSTREQLFEIITYVPSPKVVPFRKFLAALAETEFKRIESSEELPYEKVREKSKRIRNEFTKSLHDHGVFGSDIGGITDDLYRHGYGKSASSYREHKGLKPGTNIRNHMTVNELQVTSVMETLLPQVMDNNNSYGKVMVKHDAVDVGEFGSKMIREMERLLGRPVVSKENNLSPKKKLDTKKDKQLTIG